MPDFGQRYLYRGQQGATFVVAADSASLERKNGANWVCDGAADDVEIQAAIDALPSGGGKVALSEGTFTLAATIKLKSGTLLEGQGRSRFNPGTGTIITAVDSLDANLLELTDEEVTFFILRDFVIDGNKANQASGHGINIDWTGTSLTNAPRALIQGVIVASCKQDGIKLTQPSGMGGGAISLLDVHTWQNDGIGFEMGGSDMHAIACVANRNGLEGWKITGSNCQLTNCAGKGSGQVTSASGDGFLLLTGQRNQLVGCQAQDNLHDGFAVGSAHHLLVGCQADSNGKTTERRQGFRVGAAGDYARLFACYAFDRNSGEDRVQDNGVQVQATATNVIVDAATYNNYTANIADAGTATIIRRNEGFVNENSGTATLVNGQTSIAVTHGLDVTPAAGDIMVTPIEAWGAAVNFYIDTYTSTQFTIHVDADPGQDVDFAWKAVVL